MEKKDEDLGEVIAEVNSIKGKNVNFRLREKEVKHIRRCIRYYSISHDREYPNDFKIPKSDDLSYRIYYKFLSFGKLKTSIHIDRKKNIVKTLGGKCQEEGCNERDNLTIAHIKPLASGVNNNSIENLQLLCPKHHLLFDLKSILWKKNLEVDRLKKRIEDIEKRDTTDTLGFQVLSKNKFELEGNEE